MLAGGVSKALTHSAERMGAAESGKSSDEIPMGDPDEQDGDDGDGSTPDSSAEPTDDDAKYSKEEAEYRYSGDPSTACVLCANFQEPAACRLVEGLVRPVDTCRYFEARDGVKAVSAFDRGYK